MYSPVSWAHYTAAQQLYASCDMILMRRECDVDAIHTMFLDRGLIH
jgi:hypothetical protein